MGRDETFEVQIRTPREIGSQAPTTTRQKQTLKAALSRVRALASTRKEDLASPSSTSRSRAGVAVMLSPQIEVRGGEVVAEGFFL